MSDVKRYAAAFTRGEGWYFLLGNPPEDASPLDLVPATDYDALTAKLDEQLKRRERADYLNMELAARVAAAEKDAARWRWLMKEPPEFDGYDNGGCFFRVNSERFSGLDSAHHFDFEKAIDAAMLADADGRVQS